MASSEHALLAQVPALEPPPGVTPDFTTLYSGLQPLFITLTSLFLIISTFVVGARLLAKGLEARLLQIEDYIVFVAWLGFAGWCGFNLAACHDGLGRHQWNVSALRMTQIARLIDFSEIFYCAVAFVGKLALLLQYLRIFVPARRGLIYVSIHILIWTNLIVYLFVFFWLIFACEPREKIWNPTVPGKCLNPKANSLFSSSWNMVSDFGILALPLYSIWSLQMPVRRKLGVSAVFAVGLFGCIASIARIVYGVRLLRAADQNYVIIQNGLWSATELTIIIISSSLPVLPKFFQMFLSKKRATSYGNRPGDEFLRQHRGISTVNSSTLVSNGSMSLPWVESDGVTSQYCRAYIPLREVDPSHGRDTEVMGGDSRHLGLGLDESKDVERDANPNAIMKTVRLESTQNRR